MTAPFSGREILESMKRPSKFKYVYVAVVFYTLCVVIPSSVAVYWAFGDTLLTRSNAFSVLPPSGWRTTAIASIVIHQVSLSSNFHMLHWVATYNLN